MNKLFALSLIALCSISQAGYLTNPAPVTSVAGRKGAVTVSPSDLGTVTANTVLGNGTGSTAGLTSLPIPSCTDTGGNHLNWTSGTGFSCGTSGSGGTVTEGTYSPVCTAGSNVSSCIIQSNVNYIRVGNTVFINGNVNITTTTASVLSGVTITIPVASTFTLSSDAYGAVSCYVSTVGLQKSSAATTDALSAPSLIRFNIEAEGANAVNNCTYMIMYKVK